MAIPDEIYVGDYGHLVELTIKTQDGNVDDVSGATTKKILLIKPNVAAVLSKDAEFTTDGTDGKIRYITQDTDIDTAGTWLAQGLIQTASGKWHTTGHPFNVYERYEA